MENTRIEPNKITKPIQLLATWLAGLVLLVTALVIASAQQYETKWLNPFYAISAVLIIPMFIRVVFLLQTRYRVQMQEDKYYSAYLNVYRKELKEKIYTASGRIMK